MQIPAPFLAAAACGQREGAVPHWRLEKKRNTVFRELPSSASPKASLSHFLEELLLDSYEQLILYVNGLLMFVRVSLHLDIGVLPFAVMTPCCRRICFDGPACLASQETQGVLANCLALLLWVSYKQHDAALWGCLTESRGGISGLGVL